MSRVCWQLRGDVVSLLPRIGLQLTRGIAPTQVAFLSNLSSLKAVTIKGSSKYSNVNLSAADLGSISLLSGVERLHLQGCRLESLAPLTNLPHLLALSLETCNVTLPTTSGVTAPIPIASQPLSPLSQLITLQHLVLRGSSPILDDSLKFLSSLQALQTLDLSKCKNLNGSGLVHVACLTGLRYLSLEDCSLLQEPSLLELATLSGLEHLQLKGACCPFAARHPMYMPAEGWEQLLPRLPALTHLDLAGFFACWSMGPHLSLLRSLEHLVVGYAYLGEMGWLTRLSSLHGLELRACSTSELVVQAGLPSLRHLELFTYRRDDDLVALGRHAGGLTSLEMECHGDNHNAAGLSYLSDTFTCLRQLLMDCSDQKGQRGLRGIGHLSRLQSLQLLSVQFRAGSSTFRELARIPSLTSLTLETRSITARDATHLSALTGLAQLSLEAANATAALLACFATMTHMRSLTLLRRYWIPERNMEHNGLAEDAELVHVAGLTDLRDLRLSVARLDGWGLSHLSPLTCLTSLHMGVTRSNITHTAALTGLRRLSLEGPRRDTYDGYGAATNGLPPLPPLPNLTCLKLKCYKLGSNFAAAGLARLVQVEKLSLYECTIQHGALSRLSLLECLGHLGVTYCSGFTACLPDVAKVACLEKLTTQVGDVVVRPRLSHLSALTSLRQLKLHRSSFAEGEDAHGTLLALVPNLCRVVLR